MTESMCCEGLFLLSLAVPRPLYYEAVSGRKCGFCMWIDINEETGFMLPDLSILFLFGGSLTGLEDFWAP